MATAINMLGIPLFCLTAVMPNTAYTQEIPPPAYQLAAKQADVPSEVLYAVALTESGMRYKNKLIPWPWTLNIAGQGRFFRSEGDACLALIEALKTTPAKRVDIGLGQVNYGYHRERVAAPCDLLDPYLNLSIAAVILSEQHQRGEDWLISIGRYHSPGNDHRAVNYREAVYQHLIRIASSMP